MNYSAVLRVKLFMDYNNTILLIELYKISGLKFTWSFKIIEIISLQLIAIQYANVIDVCVCVCFTA